MAETSGTIDFHVGGETYQTWYRTLGNLKSSLHRPLVLLHGGPGISHEYMLPHLDLYALYGIPIVVYDQLGIGRSTHLPNKPASFWTTELFMDELENVLISLDIQEDYDLLGHSWGGMLAAEFVARRSPPGLKRLILASSPVSMELWGRSVKGLLKGLPRDLQRTLRKHEDEGTTDSEEYQDGMQVFYGKYVCTVNPWPDVLQQSFKSMADDPTVYTTMIGPSEFNITGSLKTWSTLGILENIHVPTLITNGRYDEAQDICVAPFFEMIPKAKWVQFSKSHIAFLEEKEWYMKVVGDFLS